MKSIQSKQIAAIPSEGEFDRLMARVGLTVKELKSGASSGGSSSSGDTIVNNYNTTNVENNYLVAGDCLVRVVFSRGSGKDVPVYAGDTALVKMVAFDGRVATDEELKAGIVAPVGTRTVAFLFADEKYPIPNAKIPVGAFARLTLEMVIVGSGIMALGDSAFYEGSIGTLVMKPVVPPVCASTFDYKAVSQLVVPDMAVSEYAASLGYKKPTGISEFAKSVMSN